MNRPAPRFSSHAQLYPDQSSAAPAALPTQKSEDTPPLASARRISLLHHHSTTTPPLLDHYFTTTRAPALRNIPCFSLSHTISTGLRQYRPGPTLLHFRPSVPSPWLAGKVRIAVPGSASTLTAQRQFTDQQSPLLPLNWSLLMVPKDSWIPA